MNAKSFAIVEKRREAASIMPVSIHDFGLREDVETAVSDILQNPHINLHSFDFENDQAVFVETSSEIDLSFAPFYWAAQTEYAQRMFTMPLATMVQMAQSIDVDDNKLIFIHSVGRAGSTLASQIFAHVAGVINISEPDALTDLTAARFMQPENEDTFKALLDATVRILCKTPAQKAWVIKGRSFAIELGDWLYDLFPKAKHLFLYRHAETYVNSALKAFAGVVMLPDQQREAVESSIRADSASVTPLIAQYDPDKHLPAAGMLSLMWLSVMERYVKLHEMGVEMLAIQYPSWRLAPRETAVSMLTYCNCCPDDLTAVYATLDKDSQAGTVLAQDAEERIETGAQAEDLAELQYHLQNHPFINTPDFEVPNTLKIN